MTQVYGCGFLLVAVVGVASAQQPSPAQPAATPGCRDELVEPPTGKVSNARWREIADCGPRGAAALASLWKSPGSVAKDDFATLGVLSSRVSDARILESLESVLAAPTREGSVRLTALPSLPI